jgi:hypothetical protein
MAYSNFAFLGGGGGADPTANVNITGQWTAPNPTVPQGLATKNYVDSAVVAAGGISPWNSTTTYTTGVSYVTHANSVWLCRTTGANIQPSLATNTWRQVANVDTATQCVFAGVPITAATYTLPVSQTAAVLATLSNSITVTMPTISALSSADTTGRVQLFRLFKTSQANSLIVNLGAGNTFSDGSTSVIYTAQGVYSFYCLFGTTLWFKG